MAYQSAELAFAFGLNYEVGKRTIKSMSNDKFNSLTHQQIMELQSQHHTVSMAAFVNEMPRTQAIQEKILDEYLKLEKTKIDMNITLALEMIDRVALRGGSILGNLFGITPGIPLGPNGAPLETDHTLRDEFIDSQNQGPSGELPSTVTPGSASPSVPTSTPHGGHDSAADQAQALQDALNQPKTLFQQYNEERATQYATISQAKKAYDAIITRIQTHPAEQQQLQQGKKIKKDWYNDQVDKYYKYLQIKRNSPISQIKSDAQTRYTKRFWKSIID